MLAIASRREPLNVHSRITWAETLSTSMRQPFIRPRMLENYQSVVGRDVGSFTEMYVVGQGVACRCRHVGLVQEQVQLLPVPYNCSL